MTHHVIIGGGPVATNAIESIRQFDAADAAITLICDEPAHSRMALPYWLSDQIPVEQTYTADDNFYRRLGVTARIGSRATEIETAAKQIKLDNGETVAYDKLLIATGASPLSLPIEGADLPGVQPLWSIDDTASLRQTTEGQQQPRVLMIGAGFIGFIMLNAMFKRGWKLSVVEREAEVLPRMLPATAASLVTDWLQALGVDVYRNTTVEAIREVDGGKQVQLADGQSIDVDAVVVAAGIQPNLQLATAAGIETDEGILIDGLMRTSVPDVFAGGDVAQGPVLFSDQRAIHPIQPTAVDHGRVAGANMAGQSIDYSGSLLMNVLDCCGLQCASFGRWESEEDVTTIRNASDRIFRRLVWDGDRLVGASFIGRANDMGMLTDVGMVKGILQCQTALGNWKEYLVENPFDIRKAFIANRIAEKLVGESLLGRPAQTRGYRYGDAAAAADRSSAHQVYTGTVQ